MVTSHNIIKKRKESMKALSNLKEQNAKQKLKLEKSKNKKLKQEKISAHETMQVANVENEKFTKNKKQSKKVQQDTNSIKESVLPQHRKENKSESKKTQSTGVKNHVDSEELQAKASGKMEDGNVVECILERKRVAKVNVKKNTQLTDKLFETVKSQKRKRTDSTAEEENTDCLNLNNLSKEHILQCISAIFHLTEEQLKSKNALFDDENHPVFMQVTCIRVPKTPRRYMRILLPHSLVLPNDEVALFVGDLQRGRRKDYEPTVEHYEDLLHKHGCTRIKSIIPMNQVKTEYDQYELKRKLVGSYDHFLVDGKIAGHLSHLLGREFYTKRKLPTSIRMQSKDLQHEVEYALRKTVMQMHSNGDTHIVQIGHSGMEKEEILENILATCSYLSKNYPGGWPNIRSIRLKTSISLGLPIYTTLKNKRSVNVPIVKPKRPKKYRNVSGELTTASTVSAVTVTPEGDVTVLKKKLRSHPKKTKLN